MDSDIFVISKIKWILLAKGCFRKELCFKHKQTLLVGLYFEKIVLQNLLHLHNGIVNKLQLIKAGFGMITCDCQWQCYARYIHNQESWLVNIKIIRCTKRITRIINFGAYYKQTNLKLTLLKSWRSYIHNVFWNRKFIKLFSGTRIFK